MRGRSVLVVAALLAGTAVWAEESEQALLLAVCKDGKLVAIQIVAPGPGVATLPIPLPLPSDPCVGAPDQRHAVPPAPAERKPARSSV